MLQKLRVHREKVIMNAKKAAFRAVVSSDWNECLAPCGPFDPLLFLYPDLGSILTDIFRMYTSNRISLGQAADQIRNTVPLPLTEEQMDAYLDSSFSTYRGVGRLIEGCLRRDILFMINTTGMTGYFQRLLAKGYLPRIPVLASNPLVSYPPKETDPDLVCEILEIDDKARRTEEVMKMFSIPPGKVILIGDSGGDGAHFEWGRSMGAFLIGSMTKPSLDAYCKRRKIPIDLRFGRSYQEGEPRDTEGEKEVDFTSLLPVVEEILG
jgi:hypothetical protein